MCTLWKLLAAREHRRSCSVAAAVSTPAPWRAWTSGLVPACTMPCMVRCSFAKIHDVTEAKKVRPLARVNPPQGALRTKAGIFMRLALKLKKELRSTGGCNTLAGRYTHRTGGCTTLAGKVHTLLAALACCALRSPAAPCRHKVLCNP
jgi:hypothetical protein